MKKEEILEAILFSSTEFLEKEKLAKYLRVSLEELEEMISKINLELKERPYHIISSGKRVKMTLKPEYYDLVRPFISLPLSEDEILVASLFAYSEKVEAKKLLRILGGKYSKIISEMIKKGILEIKIENGRKVFVKGPKFSEYILSGEL